MIPDPLRGSSIHSQELIMEQKILRLPNVKALTGLSRSTIYLLMSEGSFPRQIPLGSRAVGWPSEDIDNWIKGKIAHRNSITEGGA
jgi:prophage regulatory protein